jgi:NAD(P)-dependent dehydrogenase (short-subunit alcohol dehydrogenase family)
MWTDPTSWRVIVTGGSSGLGAAVCERLGKAGSQVISIDRDESNEVWTIQTDLGDGADAEAATVHAIDQLGGVDAVVCCAGIDMPGPFGSTPRYNWERVIAVNLLGTAAVVRAAMPELEASSGRIVTVASTLAHRAVADATAYCASKFGVVGFTRALAAECKGRVGVTLLTPGGMNTAFFDDRVEQYRPPNDAALVDPGHVADAAIWALGRPSGVEVKELVIMASAEGSWP